ncbi:hypothetical protein [Delftia sp. HK171]|uniref:hypothetical protein n=1 Tax=Delftia sp. HK171 TaxID=1920191 RepID=UPI001154B2DD|nr:hypothetical protein [Delftia sp. HK171]TQL81184.1 hypothetical protein FB549_2741 [Delftia sp. HK171]
MSSTISTTSASNIYILEVFSNDFSVGRPRTSWVIERCRTSVIDTITGRVLSASLDVSYSRVDHSEIYDHGHIEARYTTNDGQNCISICAALEGERDADDVKEQRHDYVCTYILNEAIKWAKEWPQARVQPIILDNKIMERLETSQVAFFRQFNLPIFDMIAHGPPSTAKCGDLILASMRIGGIRISEIDIELAFRNMQRQLYAVEQDLIIKKIRLEALRSQLDIIASGPCRWAVGKLGHILWYRICLVTRPVTSRFLAAIGKIRHLNAVNSSTINSQKLKIFSTHKATED